MHVSSELRRGVGTLLPAWLALLSSCGAVVARREPPPPPERHVACDASGPLTLSDLAEHRGDPTTRSGLVDVGDLDGDGVRELLCTPGGRLSVVDGDALVGIDADPACGCGGIRHVPAPLFRRPVPIVPCGVCWFGIVGAVGERRWARADEPNLPENVAAVGDATNGRGPVVVVRDGRVLTVDHWPVAGVRSEIRGAAYAPPVIVGDLDRVGGPEIIDWHIQSDVGLLSVLVAETSREVVFPSGDVADPIDVRVEELDGVPTIITLHPSWEDDGERLVGEVGLAGLLPTQWVCRVPLPDSDQSALWLSYVDVDGDGERDVLATDERGVVWPLSLDAEGCGVRGSHERAPRVLLSD